MNKSGLSGRVVDDQAPKRHFKRLESTISTNEVGHQNAGEGESGANEGSEGKVEEAVEEEDYSDDTLDLDA